MSKNKLLCFFLTTVVCLMVMIPARAFAADESELIDTNNDVLKKMQLDKPRIIVHDYSIDNKVPVTGELFNLTLSLQNTSNYMKAYSILVTITPSNNSVSPADGYSNQQYIQFFSPLEKKKISFPMQVLNDNQATNTRLLITIEYVNDYYGSLSNSASVSLAIKHKYNLINSISPIKSTAQFANSLLRVYVENNSPDSLYNTLLHLEGNIAENQKVYEIGTLSAGEHLGKDYFVVFQDAGTQTIKGYFTYKDRDGIEYTTDIETFSVEVTETYADDIDQLSDSQLSNADDIGIREISLFAGICLLTIIVIILFVKKKY